MTTFLCSFLYILALISITDANEINCIVCSSATDVACQDPFHGDTSTSSSLSQGGFTSCLKTLYWASSGPYAVNTVIRGGSGQSCSSSSSSGTSATVYCCSNKDNCNSATVHHIFVFLTTLLVIGSLFGKQMFYAE